MHFVEGVRVMDVDEPRPFVPLTIRYPRKDGTIGEHGTLSALVDSGCTDMIIPAASLPEDVSWHQLARTTIRIRHGLAPEPIEVRFWWASAEVFGVRIAQRIQVAPPGSRPSYPVLGLADLFTHFRVGFCWSNTPPFFTMQPVGQVMAIPDSTTRWRIDPAADAMRAEITVGRSPYRAAYPAPSARLQLAGPPRAARRALARRTA